LSCLLSQQAAVCLVEAAVCLVEAAALLPPTPLASDPANFLLLELFLDQSMTLLRTSLPKVVSALTTVAK